MEVLGFLLVSKESRDSCVENKEEKGYKQDDSADQEVNNYPV
jgi:hypothetical protein